MVRGHLDYKIFVWAKLPFTNLPLQRPQVLSSSFSKGNFFVAVETKGWEISQPTNTVAIIPQQQETFIFPLGAGYPLSQGTKIHRKVIQLNLDFIPFPPPSGSNSVFFFFFFWDFFSFLSFFFFFFFFLAMASTGLMWDLSFLTRD